MTEPEKTNPVDIRFAAMNYLAMREHTQKELMRKLRRRFPEDISLIMPEVQHLADENLQSDTRFAENYVQYRADYGYGTFPYELGVTHRKNSAGNRDIEIRF